MLFFCFCLFILSSVEVQPFVGGDQFCVVLFSFVLICPVQRSSSVLGVTYFVLVFLVLLVYISRVVILGAVVYQKGLLSLFPL